MSDVAVYRRALTYFLPDRVRIAALVAMIAVSVSVGLLEAWPLAVLVDSVLSSEPKGNWIHSYFLAVLPKDKPGQIAGLVAIGLGLQLVGYTA
jgi:subfamily B ATP-binding cassette protein MsbA